MINFILVHILAIAVFFLSWQRTDLNKLGDGGFCILMSVAITSLILGLIFKIYKTE